MQTVEYRDGHITHDVIQGHTRDELAAKLLGLYKHAMSQKDVIRITHDLNINPGGGCPCGSGKKFENCHMPQRPPTEIKRNDPCPCGSGKKFKKCCQT